MDSFSQDPLDENFKKRVNDLTTFSVSQIDDENVRQNKYNELKDFDLKSLTDNQRKYFENTLRKNMMYRTAKRFIKNTNYNDFFTNYNNLVKSKTPDYKPAIGGKSHRRKKSKSRSKSRSKFRGKSRKLDKSHGKSKHK